MKKKRLLLLLGMLIFLVILVGMGIFTKKIKINTFLAEQYPVQGIDVSHYQGQIDWNRMQEQDVKFAYIKATEGSSLVDERFMQNWEASAQTTLWVGAYHFFSFDSSGKTQAQHYIDTVGELTGKLVPVVDIEYYGDKWTNPPKKQKVIQELKDFLKALEEQYGQKPMIYTTYTVYYKYLAEDFAEYPLWIRNVYFSPNVDLRGKWTIWQYTDTSVLEGYQGNEKYIDCNVFVGTEEELESFLIK